MAKYLGTISLIFGIIGIIVSLLTFVPMLYWGFSALAFPPYFPNTIAIICGGIGIKKDDSPGLAIAGLIIGGVGLLFALIATGLGFLFW